MRISDLSEEEKKSIKNLIAFVHKMIILMGIGYVSSNYSGVDLINYKKNTFVQLLVFMLVEEKIKSYFPTWVKNDKKAKFTRAKKMTLANPINIEPGKPLSPAHHDL